MEINKFNGRNANEMQIKINTKSKNRYQETREGKIQKSKTKKKKKYQFLLMQSRNIAQSGSAIGDPKSMSQYLPNVIIKKNDNNKKKYTHT